jgi:hypothetical protein
MGLPANLSSALTASLLASISLTAAERAPIPVCEVLSHTRDYIGETFTFAGTFFHGVHAIYFFPQHKCGDDIAVQAVGAVPPPIHGRGSSLVFATGSIVIHQQIPEPMIGKPAEVVAFSVAETAISVCELSKDYSKFRDKVVAVRGVYYYGLRQDCQQKCGDGPWPSFINLEGGPDGVWTALAKAERDVEAEAKLTGKRFEIWVTVVGTLKTRAKTSRRGPCDRKSWGPSGYGHLGAFPAQINVERFRGIEVRVDPKSPYDYADMYHGPA